MTVNLVLRPPGPADEAACSALHAELAEEGFDFLFSPENTWEEILAAAEREAAGDVAPGRVRADFLLAEVDGEVVGRASVRHELNEFLGEVGGHVGYAVGKAYRRRGYATEILRQSVERLRGLGVGRVLVTCDEDNTASAAVIEGCGGVYEDTRDFAGSGPRRRYWIATGGTFR